MDNLYRALISMPLSFAITGLLVIAFSAMRAIGMFGPGTYRWLLPLSFCLMALMPWLLLSKIGRNQIGLTQPVNVRWYFLGAGLGALASLLMYGLGVIIYGHGVENWYVNISYFYKASMDTSSFGFWMLMAIFTVPAMIFSPIGEEMFFRGLLQKTLEQKLAIWKSTIIESCLFAVVHLCHHGFARTAMGLEFMPIPALLWMVQIFFVGVMFSWLRASSGSIYTAIASHMIFNLVMNLTIFLFLW